MLCMLSHWARNEPLFEKEPASMGVGIRKGLGREDEICAAISPKLSSDIRASILKKQRKDKVSI